AQSHLEGVGLQLSGEPLQMFAGLARGALEIGCGQCCSPGREGGTTSRDERHVSDWRAPSSSSNRRDFVISGIPAESASIAWIWHELVGSFVPRPASYGGCRLTSGKHS